MANTTTTITLSAESSTSISHSYDQKLQFIGTILVQCPFSQQNSSTCGTWGTYPAQGEKRQRYRCQTCKKTFNIAKLPGWRNQLTEIVWKLAQSTVEDGMAIAALAQQWNVSKSTLRTLIAELKGVLSASFELAKQLYQRTSLPSTQDRPRYRVIAYDEGFLKLLGLTAYLIFTLDSEGRPLTLVIEPRRDAETLYTHLVSAQSQLGGIDFIIADGAAALLSAAKALHKDLTVAQHIHKGGRKRARLVSLRVIPDQTKLLETTLELHTGSLLPNVESIMTTRRRKVHPETFTGTDTPSRPRRRRVTTVRNETPRTGLLTLAETTLPAKTISKSPTRLLKGPQIVVTTGSTLGQFELSYLDFHKLHASESLPPLPDLHAMVHMAQAVFPHAFITNNLAEQFNARHDRHNKYWGRKSIETAQRDLLAWATMTFYPQEAKKFIQAHQWRAPYSLVKNLLPLGLCRTDFSLLAQGA